MSEKLISFVLRVFVNLIDPLGILRCFVIKPLMGSESGKLERKISARLQENLSENVKMFTVSAIGFLLLCAAFLLHIPLQRLSPNVSAAAGVASIFFVLIVITFFAWQFFGDEEEESENSSVKSEKSQKSEERKKSSDKETFMWGRNYNSTIVSVALALMMLVATPFVVIYFWHSVHHLKGDLWFSFPKNPMKVLPMPTYEASAIYAGWLLFQAILFQRLPGKRALGLPTPSGNRLIYYVNGLNAMIVTILTFVIGSWVFKIYDLTIISDNWEGLLVITNIFGLTLTGFAWIKANFFPTHPEDRKFSGSTLYDIFMGIELNPRIGKTFDFKLFFNGRPGIVAWVLINLSFMAKQYQRFGAVSNGMILVNFLQFLYIADFFANEEWYIRTIDMAHDHFGFYFAWGDTVWLPYMYTLQSQFLAHNFVDLPSWFCFGVFALGSSSYVLFRLINNQKDEIRKCDGNCNVWGKKATVIRAKYSCVDGKTHNSILITCGYWGLARHLNYFSDILLSFSMCLCTGFQSIVPYFYIIYMIILLVHRVQRDDERCQGKYGVYWDQYKKSVKYKIIPYIY